MNKYLVEISHPPDEYGRVLRTSHITTAENKMIAQLWIEHHFGDKVFIENVKVIQRGV